MRQHANLFDRDALLRHRARRSTGSDFLQILARDEIKERLKDINRTFTSVAVVSGAPSVWADFLDGAVHLDDTDVLDFPDGQFDLVVHAMALHVANDPVGQIVQCRRVLCPDGLFLAVLPGGQTLTELRSSFASAEAAITGGLSPRVAPMSEIRDLGGLLQRAGLALPVADSILQDVSYATPFDLMRDLRAMGEANAMSARSKKFARRDLFSETARIYSETYGRDDGRITATFELIFLAGWAPDDSQPKPLRPGSAQSRLADALNVPELGPDGKPVKGTRDE